MTRRVIYSIVSALAIVVLGSGVSLASNAVVIPEPASLAILAAGVGALAWVKFRRRD